LANAKVVVTLAAGGTTVSLVSEETGKSIGGVDDLTKLLSLRSFVTKEKKQTASSENRDVVITAACRISNKEKTDDEAYVQKALDNSFVVAAKPYQMMCANVRAHSKTIEENFGTSAEYKDILRKYCQLTEKVLVDVLAAMVRGEKEKGLLDDLSLTYKLPAYIRNKLVTKTLAVSKDMDLSRILFPQDPSKGLALSVKEWRSREFVRSLGPLMANSPIIISIIQNEELFLELTGITAEQLTNAEDPRVQRVFKTRILVVPPFREYERVLAPLTKPNFRGYGLPATAMDQSKDRLANLCAVPLRAYAFSVRMAETIPDFYNRIFPDGTIRAPDEKLGNYAKQTLDAIKNGIGCSLLGIIRGEDQPKAFMAWAHRECKIIPGGDLDKKITTALGITEDSFDVGVTGILEQVPNPPGPRADVVTRATSRAELLAIDEFKKTVFMSKDKADKKKRGNAASSILSKEAKIFLRMVSRDHSVALASAMETYFRSFYSTNIQRAAVQIATARFDEFDGEDAIDESSDESSDDDEE
jgi:adenosyl cobinamide kinase/adenosyl cobinamide phosphate guanylyltransferase